MQGVDQNLDARNFIQMVWKATTSIGCSAHYCPAMKSFAKPQVVDFVVCLYMPPVNRDHNEQNVFPKQGSNTSPPPLPSPPPPEPSPSPKPGTSPKPPGISPSPPPGLNLIGSKLLPGQSFSTGTCMLSDNRLYRLCLNAYGEMAVYLGPSDPRVRWRNQMPLGDKKNLKRPYTLTLEKAFGVIDVTDRLGKAMIVLFPPARPARGYNLKLRNDGKAVLQDGAGKCLVAWGTAPSKPAGC
ncbi:hypothetical protein OEZ86_003818 [Tetradesmus obliquus]|nr:hypothetical protein OEZ86_003818 [Tetradesmus obliquus]